MRIVLIGAGSLTIATARLLIEHGHEVVIIEKNDEKVEQLGEQLDCSVVVGDGSRPAVLKDVGPKNTDFLFCLTENDQDNIIASLVGRSLGFGSVVTSIKDTDYEPICSELGLENTIFLDRTIARDLSDKVQGIERASLSAALKGGLRFFAFRIAEDHAKNLSELDLPKGTRVVALTRDGKSNIAQDGAKLQTGDEVLVIISADQIDELREKFASHEHQS